MRSIRQTQTTAAPADVVPYGAVVAWWELLFHADLLVFVMTLTDIGALVGQRAALPLLPLSACDNNSRKHTPNRLTCSTEI